MTANAKKELKELLVISQNLRSINKSFALLKKTIDDLQPEILCVQELWKPKGSYRLEGYQTPIFLTRKNKNGGGVGIWVKEGLLFTTHESIFKEGEFESQLITVMLKRQKIGVVNFYKPPNSSNQSFLDNLTRTVELAREKSDRNICVTGDANIDLCDAKSDYLTTHLTSLGLKQVVQTPTRPESDTLIDHVYVDLESTTCAMVEENGISDHSTVLFNIEKAVCIEAPKSTQSFAYSRDRIMQCKKDLNSYDWFSELCALDLDNAAERFSNILQSIVEEHCRKNNSRNPRKQKLDKKLRNLKSRVNKALSIWKQDKTSQTKKDKYIRLRRDFRTEIKRLQWAEINKMLAETNPKKLWCNIRKVTNNEKRNVDSKINIECTRGNSVEEEFNDFFTNVATRTQAQIPFVDADPLASVKDSHTTLTLRKLNRNELLEIFKGLKPKTSYGFDNLSSKVIKLLRFEILTPMKILSDKMIEESKFPSIWKRAKVIPLYKKGDKTDVNNYRPISLLPSLSKIAEKIIASQMYEYFESNDLFPKKQFGFRRGRSTIHAVAALIYEMERLKARNKRFAVVLMDLSKAFDLIDHDLLYLKLQKYGLSSSSIDILKSYLTGRSQFVLANGSASSTQPLPKVGCPQGSILGPLLYLIYTIDIENVTNNYTVCYADDTACIMELPKQKEGQKVAELLQCYESHFHANKLKINIGKTEILSNKNLEFQMRGNLKFKCTPRTTAKYLGVHMNGALEWSEHLMALKAKVRTGMHGLANIKRIKEVKVKKMVFDALINSHLNYGIQFWFPGGKRGDIKSLEKLHKAGVRMVAGARSKIHTEPVYKSMEILKLTSMAELATVTLTFDIMTNNKAKMKEIFGDFFAIQETRTRNGYTLRSNAKGIITSKHAHTINNLLKNQDLCFTKATVMKKERLRLISAYKDNCEITNCYTCSLST